MRSRSLAALLALPVLLAPPALAASAAGSWQPGTPAPMPSDWPHQAALTLAAMKVDVTAERRWPDSYAGVELDLPSDVLIVHRKPTPGLDGAIAALVPRVDVRYAYAAHSSRQINTWRDQIYSDRGYWRTRGVELHGVGPVFGRCVAVEVDNPDRDRPAIVTHYPDRPICVEQGSESVPLSTTS
ncbi:hypothetical protein ACH4T9_13460 [Micromonospora sp. NPDC020750]|uniref:hypothetical protein n=1 Tax=unclassified Micromonospora TaxID=2617518 RepID=UPI00378BDF17